MPRPIVILAALLFGCASDADQPAAQSAGAAAGLPMGGPVVAVDGERQRLSTAQLLQYVPEAAAGFVRQRLTSSGESDSRDADGNVVGTESGVSVAYDVEEPAGSGFRLDVTVRDLIDEPGQLETQRREIADRTFFGAMGTETIEDATVAGLPAQTIAGGALGPRLRMLIADRFLVNLRQTSGPRDLVDMDDLVAFVEASALPRLGEAPAFADAGDPEVPAWATAAVAAHEEASTEQERRQAADRAARSVEAEAAGVLMPCDEILSADEVAAVLGAPVDVRVTPGVEVEGESCNRTYKPAGIEGGVILIVSHYRNAETAEGALRVASDHEGKVDVRPLAGGLNGVRYTHDLSSDTHVSHFALGVDFVELKAVAALEDVPEITPDQLAEITAIAARNLGAE